MKVGKLISEVRRVDFRSFGDERGQLIALEEHQNLPFDVRRVYYMFDTTPGVKRGFHAHIALEQVAICLTGSCVIDVESLKGRESFTLDDPHAGLYMGGLVWRELRDFSEDAVVMVVASEHYTEDDYIRNYQDFEKALDEFRNEAGNHA